MNRLRRKQGKATPDPASGGTTPDRSTTPDLREEGVSRQEAWKDALGGLKTCLDLASTILSALPFQAPKAAVDTIRQLMTGYEACLGVHIPTFSNADVDLDPM